MSENPAGEPRYPIRAVARIVGIPAATLRSWERRYGFPTPARSTTARRLYAQVDVEGILWLKAQLALGLSIGQAVEWYQRSGPGQTAAGAHDRLQSAVLAPAGVAAGSVDKLTQEALRAIADYDEAGLDATLSAAFAAHPPDRVLLDLVVGVQQTIGRRWADGSLAVTAEHFASNVFRRRLFSLLAQMPVSGIGPLVALACVPGEEHDLGLLMLAVCLRWEGLRPLYLGANVPVRHLIGCLRETRAAAVCLGAVMTESASALVETATQVTLAGLGVRIYAGGSGSHAAMPSPDVCTLTNDLRSAAQTIAMELGLRRHATASGGA